MHNHSVYMYRAALLCERCGKLEREYVADENPEKVPSDPTDESTYDSDDYPKGPYPDGGGEADTPQHCDKCGVFLENPLTTDGIEYVKEQIERSFGRLQLPIALREWMDFYKYELSE